MDLKTIIGNIIGLVNYAIPVLIAVALAIFLWGVVRFVYKTGDAHGKEADKEIFVWGLIALFVLVSVWGLVGLMCTSFFDNPSCSAPAISSGGTQWAPRP